MASIALETRVRTQRCCALFQGAPAKAARTRYFWERVRVLFLGSELTGWEMLYRALAFGYRSEIIIHDTS